MDHSARPDVKGKSVQKRGIVARILLILSIGLATTLCFANLSGSLDEKHILERIKPEGAVTVIDTSGQPQAAAPVATGDVGQQIYDKYCHTCHGTGLAGAPKFGNKADWAPRIAEGIDTLVQHALHGYNAMPPKGTCMDCSDDDIKKAVEYMVSKAK